MKLLCGLHKLLKLLPIIASMGVLTIDAQAALFKNPSKSLTSFCEYPSARKTVIYLDQSIIGRKDEDWFRDLLNKMQYLPSERIEVVQIKSETGRAESVWSVCHPSLSTVDYNREKSQRGVFEVSIDKELKTAENLFNKLLGQAIAAPLVDTKLVNKPQYSVSSLPKKSLIEALYFDSKRYDLERSIRIVIFSDMAENSEWLPLGELSGESAAKSFAKKASKRWAVNFNNAEVFAYGVGYTYRDAELAKNLNTFWDYWFNKSSAYLASYEPQLSFNNSDENFTPVSFSGKMKQENGSEAAVELRLGLGDNNNLINSWFGIHEMRFPISGDYKCDEKQACSLTAKIIFGDESLKLFKKDDIIILKGPLKKLKGSIGARDTMTRTPDGKVFSLPLRFEQDNKLKF